MLSHTTIAKKTYEHSGCSGQPQTNYLMHLVQIAPPRHCDAVGQMKKIYLFEKVTYRFFVSAIAVLLLWRLFPKQFCELLLEGFSTQAVGDDAAVGAYEDIVGNGIYLVLLGGCTLPTF